ncbi:ubiquitin carboxyl-terminal hydrolase 7 [Geosmithia morbida]|uniref:ubiquitinyl hydrolase 1 n=1 Tax=Geosmithia morbida TaxID=1094350 RepID=A0A9P4YR01_9HYPO|nr:ubiquitin carboxyl-terminal hydrolase 7 [Geosmithia morbida]KAF4120217.1 ubiquitin carboxyl-terminal hydrolase 7 [Geosmithia morbida]
MMHRLTTSSLPVRLKANLLRRNQAYDIPSPNEMLMDTGDYVGVDNDPEKDPVAIINPDNLEQEGDQLQDIPLATDHDAMRELVLPPLVDEPKIVEDVEHTWQIDDWHARGKKDHGPIFHAGGYPWRILLFPQGNSVDQCSIYLEHGFEPDQVPENWSCCVQFGLVLWNPADPRLHCHHAAHHRFTKEEGDWGFTRFVELRKMFNVPWEGGSRPLCENDTANITAYVRVVDDETGVLWHNFTNYDSKKETGFVGLKNQGATCYLNSLLQSLYFTNAFRKAVYEIPTENEQSMQNSAYTLQRLFYQLQTSDQAVGTNELTKSFGWETRHIFEQQDVQELSRKLMERLEEKMKGTKAENVLAQIFSGKIKTFISCINVDYESSRIEDFWDIQLNVTGNKTLLDSFKDYIQVEKLEGENQYFAGDQYKLQDANKGVIFNSFPDVLHLQLKRFEYDIQRDMMMKINDRYEFPDVFDAAPYLSQDSDKTSEPWTYQLHGVLVHSGDLNAGHYYAFLKPEKDGWFYKYDDDRVTKATMREVLEENFGGEYRTPNGYPRALPQKKAPIMRQNSAYMLVYIRQSRLDKVLCPVTKADAPRLLQQRFEEETALKEARRREQKEAHLYMIAKVVTNETFANYSGTDLGVMDAEPASDPSAPLSYRVLRSMTAGDFLRFLASELGKDPKKMRLWVMVNRLNKTIRPDQPVMDLAPTIEDIYSKSAASRDTCLRVWVEDATEVDQDGNAIWPSYSSQPNGAPAKNDNILLLLKYFDTENQTLRGVGHAYVGKDKKVEELVPFIAQKMGWGDKLEGEDKLLLWEPLKPKQSMKAAELQDGDIVCFQKAPENKDQSAEKPTSQEHKHSDRFEDAREYYDFLEHKRVVKFLAHPTRNEGTPFDPFELVLSSKINYDTVSEKVGAHLGVPSTHIRFWTVNASTNNPKAPVRRSTNPTLKQILHPMGTNSFSSSQRNDAFYLEILDMSLAEFDTKKSIKVNWLSEGISKEEQYDVLVPKSGTIEDLIQALIKKAQLPDETESGRIRVYEASSNRVCREPPRENAVSNLSDYTQIYAERVPEEEVGAEENNFIQVFHFQNEVNRTHGAPFRFLLVEGEKFADTKKRLEKRTGLKGKSFEKIKFAVVKRSSYSKPHYLNDDDVLWDLAATEDDYLGLDHVDRARAMRNGTGDLFLR